MGGTFNQGEPGAAEDCVGEGVEGGCAAGAEAAGAEMADGVCGWAGPFAGRPQLEQ
ncbi:MAG TPA: hypothetical protein VFW31_01375 [Candidatus Angelobacter sp.]|nr:hypothetical protein [Candidatus Angelobacter sp.]